MDLCKGGELLRAIQVAAERKAADGVPNRALSKSDCIFYASELLDDYESMKYLVTTGNEANRLNVGFLLPDRLEIGAVILKVSSPVLLLFEETGPRFHLD